MPVLPSPKHQRGSVLLYALVALLLIFLGALFALRGSVDDTTLTDHFSQRQKNLQASDLALQTVLSSDLAPYAAAARELEVAATNQSWFFNTTPGQMVDTSNVAGYWASCIAAANSASAPASGSGWSGTPTATCAALPTLAGGQSAYFFVQPTGRSDSSGCGTSPAVYYDIWIHVGDPRGQVWTDTESVYRLCVSS